MSARPNFLSDPRHTWAPPQSPVRIHYSLQAVCTVQRASRSADAVGVLFGTVAATDLCVVTSRRLVGVDVKTAFETILADTSLAGLKPLGLFVSRASGEVFLTENDLALFEWFPRPDAVALVIAGDAGGFFVREPGGSIQSIQSHGEFSLKTIAARERPPLPSNRHRIPALGLAAAAVMAVAMAIMAISLAQNPGVRLRTPRPVAAINRMLALVPTLKP